MSSADPVRAGRVCFAPSAPFARIADLRAGIRAGRRGGQLIVVRSRRAWTKLAARSGPLVISAGAALWLAWLLASGDLDRNDKLASVAGMLISLAGLVVSLVSLRIAILQLRQAPAAAVLDDPARLDRAADALAIAVKAQWDAEAGLRALRQPAPLRLRWGSTARPVAAPPAEITGGTIPARVVELRLRGHLDQVADNYLALPHHRLVVLGEPGAGKTVLAMLLTLALLGRRHPGHPVPVLVGLASWDPTAEHLHTWLIRRLDEDYPALASPTFGPAAAQQLITTGRILPVLDGLDELPEPLRPHAIGELDRARSDQPLVVTCRSQEYEQAVAAGGGVLTTAAVAELAPVTAAEAIAFLRAAAGPAAAHWDPVASYLRAHPDGPLVAALSTPLMIALARTIYTAPSRNPSELVDLAKTGGQAAVELHLLDGFIPAAYTSPPPAPDTPPARPRRPPSPDQAHRWLTLLAVHLHQHGTRDLVWWELHRMVPRRTRQLVFGLVLGLAMGLALGFALGFEFGFRVWFPIGLAVGFVTGPAMSLTTGREGWHKTPAQVSAGIRGRLGDLIGEITSALRFGLVGGLAIGLMVVTVQAPDRPLLWASGM
jgi:hypothetical protein